MGFPVSGVINGNSVALTGREGRNSYTFEMTADGDSMSGTYVVTGSFAGVMNGTLSLTRVAAGVQAVPVAASGLIDVADELLKKAQQ